MGGGNSLQVRSKVGGGGGGGGGPVHLRSDMRKVGGKGAICFRSDTKSGEGGGGQFSSGPIRKVGGGGINGYQGGCSSTSRVNELNCRF